MTAKISKDTRARRRAEALRQLHEVQDNATALRVNDAGGVHITVWPRGTESRIEWWPGTAKWSFGGSMFEGDFYHFIIFLGIAADYAADPQKSGAADDPVLIDDDDVEPFE